MLSPSRFVKAVILMCFAAMLSACGPTVLTYQFDVPGSAPQDSRDRIRTIERILRENCQAGADAHVCSQYAMEAGLIYALVERQEIESDNLLRQAYDFHPNCDLRILRATAIAKRAQRRRDLSSAAALFAGEGERCDGTVARYYQAKLNILSNDEALVREGRGQLDDLSDYSLGNSGIAPEDLYDLGVYSFVSNAEFPAAERQLQEALNRGVAVSPKLQALVLVGRSDGSSFTLPPQAVAQARQYLDRRITEYQFGQSISEFIGQAKRLESVETAPWEEIENRMQVDPNLTPLQRDIVRLRFKDEFDRLQDEIAQVDDAMAAMEAYGPGLADAERKLVTAAVAAVFGDGTSDGLQEAKEAYLTALQRLADALERINNAFGDMGGMTDLYAMLVDPDAYLRAANAAAELNTTAAHITAEDADAMVLRNFAVTVSRTLSPEEFFQAYEVDLNQLGFESEQVVNNVRKVVKLAGEI